MLKIGSVQALLFAKDSSFYIAVPPGGRARRADSEMPKISSIASLLFAKGSSF